MFYHGTKNREAFTLENTFNRYPFPYFFGASNPDLAANYAHFYARNPDNVLAFEVQKITKTLDFQHQSTYSPAFRNLIFQLHYQNIPCALILNCFDRPDKNYDLLFSNILVVFNSKLVIFK
jgi:hypothetical protein